MAVVLYLRAWGGMTGVASLAGRGWLIFAALLCLGAGALAFIQRKATGL